MDEPAAAPNEPVATGLSPEAEAAFGDLGLKRNWTASLAHLGTADDAISLFCDDRGYGVLVVCGANPPRVFRPVLGVFAGLDDQLAAVMVERAAGAVSTLDRAAERGRPWPGNVRRKST